MQANSNSRDDWDDGDHGVGDSNNDAVGSTINAIIRMVGLGGEQLGLPMRAISIETAILTAAIISRRHSYAELIDLDNNCILAVFLWGNQVALNRAWRDEYDPSYRVNDSDKAPEAQKEEE